MPFVWLFRFRLCPVKAASSASRVLFIKDGEVYHQIYKGVSTTEEFYAKINDTLTVLVAGGDRR